jgi:hypothetical protein
VTESNADTVTPLDGEDGNVTGVAEQFERPDARDYKTRGQTTVATRRGYAVAPSDKSLPVVTSDGVKMTKEQAEAVVKESNGRAFIKGSGDADQDEEG